MTRIAHPRGPFALRICAGCGQQINDGHHAHNGRLAPVYDVSGYDDNDVDKLREEYREILAYTARVVEAQALDVKALGKGRQQILTALVADLREAAVGSASMAFAGRMRLGSELERLRERLVRSPEGAG